jgi:hypothetical protein
MFFSMHWINILSYVRWSWKPNLRVSKSQSDIMEDHKSFITKGFVSLISDENSLKHMKILRDMGTSQA